MSEELSGPHVYIDTVNGSAPSGSDTSPSHVPTTFQVCGHIDPGFIDKKLSVEVALDYPPGTPGDPLNERSNALYDRDGKWCVTFPNRTPTGADPAKVTAYLKEGITQVDSHGPFFVSIRN